jgi:hypothetical protein
MLTGGGGLAATAASASTAFISVEQNSAGSPASNVGQLSYNVASDMPITSMTVDIVPAGGGAPVLSLPISDFQVPADDGDGNYGTWTVTTPITTTQLPLGSYSVEVTAASADASVTKAPAGTLGFLDEVSFPTFTSSGTTFNFDNQDVTFGGTATVLTPGGTPEPFANEPLVVTDLFSVKVPVTTGPDGSFSVTIPANSDNFWVEYGGDSGTAFAQSGPIGINVVAFPTIVKAALAVRRAKYGQADKVTGTLTYSDNGVSKPLAGNTISLYSFVGASPTATTVTGSDGTFTMPVPTTGSDTWIVQSSGSAYFTQATANLPMTVAQPNFFAHFHARLDAFAIVHVSGCVATTAGTVVVEYRARASGSWHRLGHLTYNGLSCHDGKRSGLEFGGSLSARLASAYYRGVFLANPQVQGATSSSVHLSRLFTKITSFRVSPRHFSGGGHFHASGRLWAETKHGKWVPYGNRKVLVVFRFQGVYYRENREPKTNRAGWFSGRFPVYSSTPIFAQYNGDAIHFATATKPIRITESGAGTAMRPAAAQHLAAAVRLLTVRFAQLWAVR